MEINTSTLLVCLLLEYMYMELSDIRAWIELQLKSLERELFNDKNSPLFWYDYTLEDLMNMDDLGFFEWVYDVAYDINLVDVKDCSVSSKGTEIYVTLYICGLNQYVTIDGSYNSTYEESEFINVYVSHPYIECITRYEKIKNNNICISNPGGGIRSQGSYHFMSSVCKLNRLDNFSKGKSTNSHTYIHTVKVLSDIYGYQDKPRLLDDVYINDKGGISLSWRSLDIKRVLILNVYGDTSQPFDYVYKYEDYIIESSTFLIGDIYDLLINIDESDVYVSYSRGYKD